MVLATQIRDQSREYTVQVLPDARKENTDGVLFDYATRGLLLPRRGTQQREWFLRYNVWPHDYNWMVQGAFAGILKKVASTPWEIKGPENFSDVEDKQWRAWAKAASLTLIGAQQGTQRSDIEYWQQLLRQADFGAGWATFIEKGIDFLRQDRGWVWEVIAPGDPLSPPDGPCMGIAYLDSLKCRPTGDPDYPLLYFDKNGKRHLLHTSRVRRLVDMPDGDERRPGYGLCALSRAVSIANREVLSGRYVEARLDDKPPPGFVRMQGITKQERERALIEFRKEQNVDTQPEWGRILFFHGMDKDTPVEIESIPFSQAPEKFDLKVYTEVDVNSLALAIGVDVQELWQLTGGNIGSQGQSEILHHKSQGKTIGSLMAGIERAINDVLPDEYEFTFKRHDADEDLQNAQIAQTWSGAVSSMGNALQPEEVREVLANTIEAVRDAITDENGNIRRVNDLGVQPQEQLADDTSPLATLGAAPVGMPGDGAQTLLPGIRSVAGGETGLDAGGVVAARGIPDERVARTKDIQDTRLDFEAAFSDAIQAVKYDDVSRRRFGIIARALISKMGRQAYRDGLVDGGIEDDELSEDDLSIVAGLAVEQSVYVTAFADTLFEGSDPDPDAKAEMWFAKSIMPFYQEGLMSADKNGLYEWVYGDTDHCDDCARLNGQSHRLSGWLKSGFMPQGEALACKGFRCACALVKTSGRARGSY